jgi:hypothetical protein
MLKLSKHKSLYFEFIFNQNQLYQIQFCENQFYFRQNQTHTIRYTEPKIFKSLDDVDIIRIFTTSKTREKKIRLQLKLCPSSLIFLAPHMNWSMYINMPSLEKRSLWKGVASSCLVKKSIGWFVVLEASG